jgi:hypothetical protein
MLSTLFDPFNSAIKMSNWVDRIMALPIIFALHIAWKCGMVVQKLKYSV